MNTTAPCELERIPSAHRDVYLVVTPVHRDELGVIYRNKGERHWHVAHDRTFRAKNQRAAIRAVLARMGIHQPLGRFQVEQHQSYVMTDVLEAIVGLPLH